MQISPEKKTIQELLKSRKQFLIPRFQREFVWDSKQYKIFLEDIVSSLGINDDRLVSSQYFIGTMLFIGNFSDTNSKEFKVVDGQQRLTTITILFSVISRLFYENGETDIANSLFDYIMTKDDDGAPVRIIKTETSHPYFADCIQRLSDRKDVKTETEEEDNIKEVYEYFYYNLSEQGIRKLFKKCLT